MKTRHFLFSLGIGTILLLVVSVFLFSQNFRSSVIQNSPPVNNTKEISANHTPIFIEKVQASSPQTLEVFQKENIQFPIILKNNSIEYKILNSQLHIQSIEPQRARTFFHSNIPFFEINTHFETKNRVFTPNIEALQKVEKTIINTHNQPLDAYIFYYQFEDLGAKITLSIDIESSTLTSDLEILTQQLPVEIQRVHFPQINNILEKDFSENQVFLSNRGWIEPLQKNKEYKAEFNGRNIPLTVFFNDTTNNGVIVTTEPKLNRLTKLNTKTDTNIQITREETAFQDVFLANQTVSLGKIHIVPYTGTLYQGLQEIVFLIQKAYNISDLTIDGPGDYLGPVNRNTQENVLSVYRLGIDRLNIKDEYNNSYEAFLESEAFKKIKQRKRPFVIELVNWWRDKNGNIASNNFKGDYIITEEDKNHLQDFVEEIHKHNGKVVLYIESRLADEESEFIQNGGKNHALRYFQDGKPIVKNGEYWMDPQSQYWQNHLLGIIDYMRKEIGIDGIYFDSAHVRTGRVLNAQTSQSDTSIWKNEFTGFRSGIDNLVFFFKDYALEHDFLLMSEGFDTSLQIISGNYLGGPFEFAKLERPLITEDYLPNIHNAYHIRSFYNTVRQSDMLQGLATGGNIWVFPNHYLLKDLFSWNLEYTELFRLLGQKTNVTFHKIIKTPQQEISHIQYDFENGTVLLNTAYTLTKSGNDTIAQSNNSADDFIFTSQTPLKNIWCFSLEKTKGINGNILAPQERINAFTLPVKANSLCILYKNLPQIQASIEPDSQTLSIQNTGKRNLEILDIVSPHVQFSEKISLPYTIQKGASETFSLECKNVQIPCNFEEIKILTNQPQIQKTNLIDLFIHIINSP